MCLLLLIDPIMQFTELLSWESPISELIFHWIDSVFFGILLQVTLPHLKQPRQIRKSAVLHSSATIDAYVVGAKLGDIDPEKETTSGRIHAVM